MHLFVMAFILFVPAFVSGCGTVSSSTTTLVSPSGPSSTMPASPKPRKAPVVRDYGAAPGADARAAIEKYMQQTLHQPYNAHYRYVNAPVKGSHGGWPDTPVAYGYVMCVWINARTSDGRYTGEQLNFFLIRNDEVVRAASNGNWLCRPYI